MSLITTDCHWFIFGFRQGKFAENTSCRCTRQKYKSVFYGRRTQADFLSSCRTADFCRGQIWLKFVGPSACRTLANFLSRLTVLRDGARVIQNSRWRLFHWLSRCFLFLVEAHARALTNHTLADKAWQHVLRSSTSLDKPRSCRRLVRLAHRTLSDK